MSATDECDDSRLCAELNGDDLTAFADLYDGDPPGRILYRSQHFAVLIDLAPLVEGHLLIVPTWHALSFGQVPLELWPELIAIRDKAILAVSRAYGDAVILEHGSSSDLTFSACVSHAHWHVLPVSADLRATFAADGLTGHELQRPEDLTDLGARDTAYIFYDSLGRHGAWVYPGGLSKRHQYLRAVVAEHVGIPDPEWDWSVVQRLDLLRATHNRLAKAWS